MHITNGEVIINKVFHIVNKNKLRKIESSFNPYVCKEEKVYLIDVTCYVYNNHYLYAKAHICGSPYSINIPIDNLFNQ